VLKIMVLDGHASNAATYKRITTDIPGSQVTCYADLESAFAACPLESPDIVLIDEDVAPIDPIVYARRFKERAGMVDPLIVLIGFEARARAENARMNGIDIFVPKPVQTELFVALLRDGLAYHAAKNAISHAASAA
jgi:DNA-binding NarL/FixJ family response regulator